MYPRADTHVGTRSLSLTIARDSKRDNEQSPIAKLRGMTPRAALTKHLLDGDDSIFTGKFDGDPKAQGPARPDKPEKPQSGPGPAAVTPPADTSAATKFDTDAT